MQEKFDRQFKNLPINIYIYLFSRRVRDFFNDTNLILLKPTSKIWLGYMLICYSILNFFIIAHEGIVEKKLQGRNQNKP